MRLIVESNGDDGIGDVWSQDLTRLVEARRYHRQHFTSTTSACWLVRDKVRISLPSYNTVVFRSASGSPYLMVPEPSLNRIKDFHVGVVIVRYRCLHKHLPQNTRQEVVIPWISGYLSSILLGRWEVSMARFGVRTA